MNNRRPRIGLLINDLEGGYLGPLWTGIRETCSELSCDLFIYEGRQLESPIRNQRQHNIIYRLAQIPYVDGFIVLGSTLGFYCGDSALNAFLDSFAGRPIVSIGKEIPGISTVMAENTVSMTALVMHLLLDHRRTRLVFMGPNAENPDTLERFEGFREAHRMARITIFEDRIIPCGFEEPHGYEATIEYMRGEGGKRPPIDGIVYVNDGAAAGGIRALKELGLRVPQDISVIGFDDSDAALAVVPPITTVHQPLTGMADKAVRLLVHILRKEAAYDPGRTVRVESVPVFRQSCGCLEAYSSRIPANEELQNQVWRELVQEFSAFLDDGEEEFFLNRVYEILTHIMTEPVWLGAFQNIGPVFLNKAREQKPELLSSPAFLDLVLRIQMIHGALMSTAEAIGRRSQSRSQWNIRHRIHEELDILNIRELFAQLSIVLPDLGISGCAVAFYGTGVFSALTEMPAMPKVIKWQFSYWEGKSVPLPEGGLEGRSDMPIPPGLDLYENGRPAALLYQPLFHQNEHFGFIVFQAEKADESIYEGVRSQLSGLIKASRVLESRTETARRLRDNLIELETHNRELINLSMRDELTGLFNRRGFIELGSKMLTRSVLIDEPVTLIYIDLDFLKLINDRFGHSAGDTALRDTADAITESIRARDIPARIGGDEFTVLIPGIDKEQVDLIRARLLVNLEKIGNKNSRPYPLSISSGVQVWIPSSGLSLERLLIEADRLMYEQKVRVHREKPEVFR